MMEIENQLELRDQTELLDWLSNHHETENVAWIVSSVKPEADKIQYLDLVEAALCYGWIDSTKKKLPDGRTVQRISPRSKKSNWTELNKERVRRLEKLGLMTPAGRAVLPDMSKDSFQIQPNVWQAISGSKNALKHYEQLPELYTRIRIDTIQSVAKEPETFQKRLDKFIAALEEGKMIGQWNDSGRLGNDVK